MATFSPGHRPPQITMAAQAIASWLSPKAPRQHKALGLKCKMPRGPARNLEMAPKPVAGHLVSFEGLQRPNTQTYIHGSNVFWWLGRPDSW